MFPPFHQYSLSPPIPAGCRVAGHKSLDTSRSVKVAGDKPMHSSESLETSRCIPASRWRQSCQRVAVDKVASDCCPIYTSFKGIPRPQQYRDVTTRWRSFSRAFSLEKWITADIYVRMIIWLQIAVAYTCGFTMPRVRSNLWRSFAPARRMQYNSFANSALPEI